MLAESSGRANQKARTRAALVDAAIALVAAGGSFTVADVADRAHVSRTTAYNYFPTIESLYAQAVLTFVSRTDFPNFAEQFARTDDVAERVETVVGASDASIAQHEHLFRAMLRASLGAEREDLPRRPAFRQECFADALAPLQGKLDPRSLQRLTAALSLCTGIEAQVALRDVLGLSQDEARRVKLWAARALVDAAVNQRPTRRRSPQ
jgi:AcrR family transcriptional regulator